MSDSPRVQFGTQEPPATEKPAEARAANHGIIDPAEPGHRLPEGLERKRAGPRPRAEIRKDSGV